MMEQILSRPNLLKAIKRVEKNKGSHGIDQMPTTDLRVYVMENWHTMREQLLSGTYQPQPVRRVEIPKPNGGVGKLGISTVTDRLIQQAQQLTLVFDPTFSELLWIPSKERRIQRSNRQELTKKDIVEIWI